MAMLRGRGCGSRSASKEFQKAGAAGEGVERTVRHDAESSAGASRACSTAAVSSNLAERATRRGALPRAGRRSARSAGVLLATCALLVAAAAADVGAAGDGRTGAGEPGSQDAPGGDLSSRQAVDDWTPAQVALWLEEMGASPHLGDQRAAAARLDEYGIGGHLLLSVPPHDLLAVADPELEHGDPPAYARAEAAVRAGQERLRALIRQHPVDFWEWRVAHRRTAALLQLGFSTAPRVAIVYMLVAERRALQLAVGPHGLSLLSAILALLAPNLAVAWHAGRVAGSSGAGAAGVLAVLHVLSFAAAALHYQRRSWAGALASTAQHDLVGALALAALAAPLHVLPWWIVDVALCLSLAAQLAEGLLGAWGWALRGRAWAAGRGGAKWRAERARHVTMRGVMMGGFGSLWQPRPQYRAVKRAA